MTLEALPSALVETDVAEQFFVTAVANFKSCRLKVILESDASPRPKRLPAGPAAGFGTVVHEALEIANVDQSRALLHFRTKINDIERQYRETPDFDGLDIAEIFDSAARIRAEQLISSVRQVAPGFQTVQRPDESGLVRPRRRGPEVRLSSVRLRLRGTADRVVASEAGGVEIVDFKTGQVVDENGELRSHYVRQVQSYALMLREAEPTTVFHGYLDNGDRHEISLGYAELFEFEQWLSSLMATMPPSGRTSAHQFADPGPDCVSCSFRQACSPYLSQAPGWWKEPPPFRIPLDTAGRVHAVTTQDVGSDVELQDLAGRDVRIVALGSRHGDLRSAVGSKLWVFGLRSVRVQRDREGRHLHPRVLRDLSPDGQSSPAFESAVFLSKMAAESNCDP